jgi:hypothetical protein
MSTHVTNGVKQAADGGEMIEQLWRDDLFSQMICDCIVVLSPVCGW